MGRGGEVNHSRYRGLMEDDRVSVLICLCFAVGSSRRVCITFCVITLRINLLCLEEQRGDGGAVFHAFTVGLENYVSSLEVLLEVIFNLIGGTMNNGYPSNRGGTLPLPHLCHLDVG